MSLENYNTYTYVPSVPLENYQSDKDTSVATPCLAYKDMYAHWELPVTLMGGTLAIKAEGRKYLPQEPKESYGAYKCRLDRTVLYEAYPRTIQALAGLAFTSPVVVEDVPPELQYLLEDTDNMGTDLTSLANDLLEDQLNFGITHLLVDMPQVEGTVTLAQQEELKIRPYFTHVSPLNLISWSVERVGGLLQLSEIRIKETVVEKDGWAEKEVEQVRQITRDSITLWKKKEREWHVVTQLPNNLGYIPLVTIYGNKTGVMTARPPLEGLAWLNLRHYQKLSDLDNIEHIVNVPFLFGRGFKDGELNGATIGAYRLISTDVETADLKFVEHSGSSIGASQNSLDKLEARMASMGADILIRKSVDRQTATARMIDQSESISLLQIMVNNLEGAIQKAFKIAGDWIDVSSKVIVNIGNNLKTSESGPNTADKILDIITSQNGMTVDQAIVELQRRGILSDTYNKTDSTINPVTPSDQNGTVTETVTA